MGRRSSDWDEESYYDDDEFLEDYEDEQTQERGRLAAVLGTSYGLSAVVHVAIAAALTLIVLATPEQKKVVTILSNFEQPEEPYDPEAEKDLKKQEEVPLPEPVEEPVMVIEQEAEPDPIPAGSEANASNKNLSSDSYNDAYGLSGRPAGARGRGGTGKLIAGGGGKKTESAVRGALRWLKRAQSRDGRWDSDNWTGLKKHQAKIVGGKEDGHPQYDVGLSSLALLAFYGNGMTHRVGPFKRCVKRGIRWVLNQQRTDGSIGYVPGKEATIYNHAIATMLLCDALATSQDSRMLRVPAQKAVRFALAAQNPGNGWKYDLREGHNDTSVTGWMILALKGARNAGLEVPDEAFKSGMTWIDWATDSDGYVGYESPGGGSAMLGEAAGVYDALPTMTAVGVASRIFAGEKTSTDMVRKGVKHMLSELPDWKTPNQIRKVNFYYWYYATYAMFQVNGKPWKRWNVAMKDALVPRQRSGGIEDGSWDPVGEWCLAGGRVYATAINALTLEIYYRYDRMHGGGLADKGSLYKKTSKTVRTR